MTLLKSAQFRRERERTWRRLESLVERIERKGIRSLSEADVEALPSLHRATVSALSVARAVSLDRNLLEYLEALTARSYFCVYSTRRDLGSAIAAFFLQRFPAAVRGARWHLLLACAFMLAGVITGFALTLDDPDRYYSFISKDMAQGRDPAASDENLRAVLFSNGPSGDGVLTLFATFLFQHNTQVGFLCFALGFGLGIPVFYLLFTNGLLLGAMSALYHSRGLSVEFWSWILPHGITELGAIVLCGAAGLVQAQAILFPGRRSRMESLSFAGRRAGLIAFGCVALFAIAALLEGYFRQLVDSVPIRYTVAMLTLLLWLLYFAAAGRKERQS